MPCAVKRARLTASKIFQRLFPLEYEEGVCGKNSVNQIGGRIQRPGLMFLRCSSGEHNAYARFGVNNSRKKVNERERT